MTTLTTQDVFTLSCNHTVHPCLMQINKSLMAHEASLGDQLEVPMPEEPSRAPFDWGHADLSPLRDVLVAARQRGTFSPQSDLPL